MNKLKLSFTTVLTLLLILSSCSSMQTLSNGKQINTKLVGVWQGSETDKQVKGINKKWEMTRRIDGTFTLNFKTIYNGQTDELIEEGNWWVKENKFFEYHKGSEKTDSYNYTILNKDQIKFEMLSTEVEFEDENYTFIDTRVSNPKLNKSDKDGLSLENAIKVKSVSEEYEYVKRNCEVCQLLGQALIQHKGKPYDEIRLKKENGEEISYYFDISSFYGKW